MLFAIIFSLYVSRRIAIAALCAKKVLEKFLRIADVLRAHIRPVCLCATYIGRPLGGEGGSPAVSCLCFTTFYCETL